MKYYNLLRKTEQDIVQLICALSLVTNYIIIRKLFDERAFNVIDNFMDGNRVYKKHVPLALNLLFVNNANYVEAIGFNDGGRAVWQLSDFTDLIVYGEIGDVPEPDKVLQSIHS